MPPGVQCDPRNSSGAEQGPPRGPRSVPGQVSTGARGSGASMPTAPGSGVPPHLGVCLLPSAPLPAALLGEGRPVSPRARPSGSQVPLSCVPRGHWPSPTTAFLQMPRKAVAEGAGAGRGGGLRVHRAPSSSSPEGALGGDPPPHHLTSRPPRTETTAPAPAPAFSSPHTSASTGPGSGSTWTLPRPCTL